MLRYAVVMKVCWKKWLGTGWLRDFEKLLMGVLGAAYVYNTNLMLLPGLLDAFVRVFLDCVCVLIVARLRVDQLMLLKWAWVFKGPDRHDVGPTQVPGNSYMEQQHCQGGILEIHIPSPDVWRFNRSVGESGTAV